MIVMCIDILKNPVSALMRAKKQKNTNKTWIALVEACILFGLAAAVVVAKGGVSQLALTVALTAALSVFLVIFLISIVMGFVLKIIVNNLGGSGKYYEGLTAISYSLLPLSVSLFIAALLSLLPGGVVLSSIALAIGFGSGISLLYRSIKELFKTDMVTALIAVSILIIVLFVAASVSFGLTTLTRIGTIFPVVR